MYSHGVCVCIEPDWGAAGDGPARGAERESVVYGQTDPCVQTTQYEGPGEDD